MEPKDEFKLTTPGQWKAMSHPLRLRMLGLLAERALTNEELADALGEASGKLYFHTRRLREAGLIVPDGTRQKGPITEKLYRAVARQYIAAPPVKGGDAPPLDSALASALDLYRSNWRETGGLRGQTEIGFHLILTLTRDREREFVARVRALFEEYGASGSDVPDARPVSLAVLMHSFGTERGNTDATGTDAGTDGNGRERTGGGDGVAGPG